MNFKTPTQKQKIAVYEQFLHQLALYADTGNRGLGDLINKAGSWSYAHRVGNGELPEKKQQEIVNKNFWNLTAIPDILK